jgi:uncharacterized protein (DUF2336 family)
MSSFDSTYLLELARKRSSEGRSDLAAAISDLFDGEGAVLTDRERALMYEILHGVVRDTEMAVRKLVSSRLADRADAPMELVSLLANDDIEVAFPVLSENMVLKDEQLIDVVRQRTLEHQMAVAIRQSVSEEVSEALVEQGDERVIRTLLQNENADISEKTMEFLVEQSERVDTFQEPVLNRRELQPDMAKRMFLWVSAALRKHIVDHCGLDKAEIDELMEAAALESLAVDENTEDSKSEELAQALLTQGTADPALMIRALRDGEVRLFVDLLAESTGVRHDLIMRFVLEPSGESLAVACKSLDMTIDEFKSVFMLCRKARPIQMDNFKADAEAAVLLFAGIELSAAKEVVERWKRDEGYLAALRDLNMI